MLVLSLLVWLEELVVSPDTHSWGSGMGQLMAVPSRLDCVAVDNVGKTIRSYGRDNICPLGRVCTCHVLPVPSSG